jgi:hypothetical protein
MEGVAVGVAAAIVRVGEGVDPIDGVTVPVTEDVMVGVSVVVGVIVAAAVVVPVAVSVVVRVAV